MSYAELATALQSRLSLSTPPVALAFVQAPPAGVPRLDMAMPSACALWRRAESGVFFATAADHFHCPLGAHVMGFSLPENNMQELMAEVTQMCEIAYVDQEEVGMVPRMAEPSAGIVYGPLANFPLTPDVVLLWTTPAQAMVVNEAFGMVSWVAEAEDTVLGRPGCAVIPQAIKRGRPAQSFGCIGMRMFTEAPGDQFLMAIPGGLLDSVSDHLFATLEIHRQMRDYYRQRAARLTATRD